MLKPKVRHAIESWSMFSRGDLVVVGVSGGPDSVALLHALVSLKAHFGYRLHVAHLNHGLRGRQSDLDAEFVGDLAAHLGVPATVEKRDVASVRRQWRLGLEEAARVVRYQFFAELVERMGAGGVAVGHTADDQVETVVLHWLRGTGLVGLRGMCPVAYLQVGSKWTQGTPREIKVVRPMLDVTRREVEDYVKSHGLPTRVDVSNLDPRILRNRVRLELLPYLEQYNPRFRQATLRTARIAAQDYDYIQSQVLSAWSQIGRQRDNELVVDLDGWLKLPSSLQYYTLRHAATLLLGDAMDISTANLEAAVEALRWKPVGTTIVWPRQLRLVKGYDDFRLIIGEPRPSGAIKGLHRLIVPGRTRLPEMGWEVLASIGGERCVGGGADRWHADLDLDATGSELYVRGRQPGDVFQPLGMGQAKKLQDFFVDAKVPRDERDAIPIVVSPEQIVWVAGHRIDERVKVDDRTRRVLCLTFAPSSKS